MNHQDYELFMSNCDVVGQLATNKHILLIQGSNEKIISKAIRVGKVSPLELKQLKQTLSSERDLYHDHLLPVIDYYWNESDRFIVFTQFHHHSLREELTSRIHKNQPFSIQELQNILMSLVTALRYLEQHSIGHGCITLDDIFIADNGYVKLVDPALASNSPFNLKQPNYYSPQLLSQKEEVNFFKNDVFVLAMNILELGLLHSVKGCYYERGIDENTLDQYIAEFQENYNNRLTNILYNMLNFDPCIRLSLQDILRNVEKWEDMSESDERGSFYHPFQEMEHSDNLTVGSFLLDGKSLSRAESSLKEKEDSMLISNRVFSLSNKENMGFLRNI